MADKIPKIIHYCWFGNRPKPDMVLKRIESWGEKMPGYKIIEWNEHNFDIGCSEYVKEAYEFGKYAFVSDVARLHALYKNGGIYFDTDIDVLRSFDDLLVEGKDLYGFESNDKAMTAMMGCQKGSKIIKQMLEQYDGRHFIDGEKGVDIVPNTVKLTAVLVSHGLVLNGKKQISQKFVIYPLEYFSAYNMLDNTFNIVDSTRTVHRLEGSWLPKHRKVKRKMKQALSKVVGPNVYDKLRRIKKGKHG